jgi:putative oxidoreductase
MMDLALLIVRLLFGLGLAVHGAQKLFGWYGGYGLEGTGGFFAGMGFRPGKTFALAAGLAEFGGGLLVALGLFGPVGPALMVSVMTVAMLTVHRGKGFLSSNNGSELPLLYVAGAIALALVGPGALSLDAALGMSDLWTPATAWTLLALGVLGGAANLALRRPDPVVAQSAKV